MKEIRILAPTGMIGYGIEKESFENGLMRDPHAIVADAGSTDAGPHKLGGGVGIVSRMGTKNDLDMMLSAGLKRHIPVVIGSAGGSGGQPHIRWTMQIVEELAREKGWTLKVAVINATADPEWVKAKLQKGQVRPMNGVPDLTEDEIDQATEIVAQMGHEPYLEALDRGVDLIVGGRSYDPAMAVAVCVHHGIKNLGPAYHMGKIIECGSLCTIPGGGGPILGIASDEYCVIQSLSEKRLATPLSVAAHTLYEKTHPYILPGPGGVLNLEESTFEQLEGNAVRIKGSRFIEDDVYRIKLEGARLEGYRTVFIAAIRDPLVIASLDELLKTAEWYARNTAKAFGLSQNDFCIDFKIYGRNGVLKDLEPVNRTEGHELCVVTEVMAHTQELASMICSKLRAAMMHGPYPGRKSTAGNIALPFAPSDFEIGASYRFNVYHLAEVDDPIGFFKTTYRTVS